MDDINLLILLKSVDGGTGTYLEGLLDLSKVYKPQNIEINVLVLEKPKFRNSNIDGYTYFPRKRAMERKYRLRLDVVISLIKEIIWFKQHINKFHPNIVLSSDAHSILISETTKKIFNFKYKTISVIQNNLTRVFEYRLQGNLRPVVKSVFSYFLRKSNSVVTVSKYLSKDVYKLFGLDRLPATISMLMPNKVLKTDNLKNRDEDRNIIVSVARLDNQKDHETLLKAFDIVYEDLKNTELWIVGDGPLLKELKILTSKLGIKKSVKFFGWVQDSEKLLQKCDVFVLSSKWEGFPLSILEAMCVGLPVIASDCKYGPREIIGNNTYGILFPVGDYNKLAESLISLLRDKKKRNYYAKKSKERHQKYLNDRMLLKYKRIIDSIK